MGTVTVTVEVWVMVDSDGDYAVGVCEDTVRERFAEEVTDSPLGCRCVKLLVTVPLPSPVEVSVTVPSQGVPVVQVA